jgi:hypothetical protein
MKHEHRPRRVRYANWLALSVGVALLAVACGAEAEERTAAPPTPEEVPPSNEPGETAEPAPPPVNNGPAPQVGPPDLSQLDGATFVEDDNTYVISQLLPIDGIAPIYDPQFVTADEATYVDEEMVIGVEINGEAKAYPITLLNRREMVNDELGGTPMLVTW